MSDVARVLVAEPSAPLGAAFRKLLSGVADVQVTSFVDEAMQLVRESAPSVVIASVSGTFDGEVLSAQIRKQAPSVSVIVSYPPGEEHALERADAVGADAFLVGPPKRPAVLSAVRSALRIHGFRAQMQALEKEVKAQSAKTQSAKKPEPEPIKARAMSGVNTGDQAFMKKYMLLEVKRSKRYQYPVAILLVGLDKLEAFLSTEKSTEFQRSVIRSEVLMALGELTRDIDLVIPFGDDRYMVFLPHTARQGATTVANRVVKRLSKVDSFFGGTASVGVAAYDPKSHVKMPVTYGGLMRDAAASLKHAQFSGGNRVEVAALPAGAKRDRISIG